MVCADCPYTQCIGTDCAKAVEAFNAVKDAYPNLKGVFDPYPSNNLKPTSQDKNTGTGSNLAVAAAERQAAEENQKEISKMNCPHKNECGAYTPNSITCNLGGSTYCGIYRNLTRNKTVEAITV